MKKKESKEYFIGVRFTMTPRKIFTYKVLKPVLLGDELVVENEFGTAVVIVVRLGKGEWDGFTKTIRRKVVDI